MALRFCSHSLGFAAIGFFLTACATVHKTGEATAQTAATPQADSQAPERPPFAVWLAGLKAEAIGAGIRAEIVDAALANVTYDQEVVQSDRNQPEVKLTLETYLAQRLTPARIKRGREMMIEHRAELAAVAKVYNVQPRFIVAIWGMETNYGSFIGNRDTIQSLVTLAYDPRRSAYFRKELLAALKILDEGHVAVGNMKGSWAGAMGQSQFMPTSFLAYAVDFDGDNRRDIWTTPVDVFASIANYLKTFGWRDDQTWGREVKMPQAFDGANGGGQGLMPPANTCAVRNHAGNLTLGAWNKRGVRRLSGAALPAVNLNASLARPDGADGRAFLTYGNYRSILRYNCSDFYAIAVGLLADNFTDLD